MAASKPGRKPGAPSQPAGPGGKSRDRGTRGGRPEAQPTGGPRRPESGADRAGARRAGNGRNRAGDGGGKPGPAPVAPGSASGRAERKPPAALETAPPGGSPVPAWLRWTTLALSLGGLGVSTYLTIAHYTTKLGLFCPESGRINCAKVTSSPESHLLGIPVAVLGLAFFVVLVAITSPWAWRAAGPLARFGPLIGRVRLWSVTAGMVFVLYLVYTEVITLNMTICLWCTAVHVITFLLFALIVFAAVTYGAAQPSQRG